MQRYFIFLFVLITGISLSVPANGEPIIKTEWVVEDQQNIQNETIEMNGVIVVKTGGILRLENVNLIFKCTWDGEFGLTVEPGAELYINESNITAQDPVNMFYFFVDGSNLTFQNSELHGCHAIRVNSGNALIENNTLTNNRTGIEIFSSGVTVTNNHIDNNKDSGIVMNNATGCKISENFIQASSSGFPIFMINSHGNEIISNEIGQLEHAGGAVIANSNNNLFENNNMFGRGFGVDMMYSCDNNIIRGNTITTDEAAMMIWGWNNRAENNICYDTGIYLVHAFNTVVTGNTLSNLVDINGIFVRRSSNNTISNNTVTSGNATAGTSTGLLLFDLSKKNLIRENKFLGFDRGMSFFYECDENVVTGNEVESAKVFGLLFDDCNQNAVYSDNTFKNVAETFYDNGTNVYDVVGPAPDIEVAVPPQFENVINSEITDEQLIENQTITIGNIRIKAGGSLSLNNVNIIAGGKWEPITYQDLPYYEAGITVHDGGKLYIKNCQIRHAEYGYGFQMDIHQNAVFEMENSELYGCGNEWWYGGLRIEADNAKVSNNLIKDAAINIFGTSGSNITGNTILRSYCALNFEGSNNAFVTDNVITNTIFAAIRGTGSNNTFKGNSISGLWGDSINIWEGVDNIYEENMISGAKKGFPAICLWGSNPKGIGNIIENCHTGLSMIKDTQAEGNTIKNCVVAIDLIDDGSRIRENFISKCDLGIKLIGGSNIIQDNMITDCSQGIFVGMGQQNNQIYYNHLLGNIKQAVDNGLNNLWDDENNKKGNWWSDYIGTDMNGDGIGDTPYYIVPNGIDRYPQMPSTPPDNPPDDNGDDSNGNVDNGNGSGSSGSCFIGTSSH